ncbi:Anaphase-promoting complex subunit 5 [Carpediemonas membranifera]|uniref:Anaphase-promoting complex subunit 5 n=1 Tax=Carpediemonas membranifera TaxID=201153 RepID=A0A8J6EAU1_9EUKA|nr:Anaphase-promoting complex subunit 5 [Carpediemonas membranifera]|eukprot:KAG9395365.1 Anaphase-promoting complex subunit 5 [Carpediemonas membranifera]
MRIAFALFILAAVLVVNVFAQKSGIDTGRIGAIDADKITAALEKVLTDFGASESIKTCVQDIDNVYDHFVTFADAWKSKDYQNAATDLAHVFTTLSTTISDCDLKDVDQIFTQIAAVLKTASVDLKEGVAIYVDGKNIFAVVEKLEQDWTNDDIKDFAADFSTLTGYLLQLITCTNNTCKQVQDVLKTLNKIVQETAATAAEVETCLNDGLTIYKQFETFSAAWKKHDYENAAKYLATAFDEIATGISDCDLGDLDQVFTQFAALLKTASVDVNKGVELYIDGQNIAHTLEKMHQDWEAGATDAFASDVATLVGYLLPLIKCSTTACQTAAGVLRVLDFIAKDLTPCVGDIEKAGTQLHNAAALWDRSQYQEAVSAFGTGLRTLGNAANDCGFIDLSKLIVTEAQQIFGADIHVLSDDVKVIVNDVDLANYIYDAVKALDAHDYVKFGTLCGTIVAELRASSCTSEACIVIEGILEGANIFFPDLSKCSKDLEDGYDDIKTGFTTITGGHIATGIQDVATGLDKFGAAVQDCELPELAQLIQTEASHLTKADVSGIGKYAKLIVKGVDIYDDVYKASEDLANHDFAGAGLAIGDFLSQIRGASCKSEGCQLVVGLLQALNIVLPDLETCESDFDSAFNAFEDGIASAKAGHWSRTIDDFGNGLHEISQGVSACHLTQLAELFDQEASHIKGSKVSEAEGIVKILVGGLDLFDDIDDAYKSYEKGDITDMGKNIGNVVSALRSIGCTSRGCKFAEGILSAVSEAIIDFAPCASTLEQAMTAFEQGVKYIEEEKWDAAFKAFNLGLEDVASATKTCLIPHLEDDLNNFAKLFKLGKTEGITGDLKILVAGINIFEDLQLASTSFKSGDYAAFGQTLGSIMSIVKSDLDTHCEDDKWCLLLSGAVQGLNMILPNVHQCKHDGEVVWNDFMEAYRALRSHGYKDCVHDLAQAMDQMEKLISDCDVEEIAELILKLAAEISGASLSWWEKLVKIVIHGVDIADDVIDLIDDVESENVFGVGIDVAKLVKIVLL